MRPNGDFVDVKKAAITSADALATAGKLNPQQVREFRDTVIDQSAIKGHCRVVKVEGSTWELSKIGVGQRAMVAASEAKDPGVRRGVSTSKISITPARVMLPFEIGDEFKLENVEGAPVEKRILRMFGAKFANDSEELYIEGDPLGYAQTEAFMLDGGDSTKYVKDTFLALQNGFLNLSRGTNDSDAAGGNVGLSIFGAALRKMPIRFRRDPSKLRFFCPVDLAQLFQERVASRGTALGDQAMTTSAGKLAPFGVPLVPLPLLPSQPRIVEHLSLPDGVAVSLKFAPVSNVTVLPNNLASTPTTPYTEGAGNDYTLDATAGTVTNNAGGNIANNQTVKVSYLAGPQMILTHEQNFVIGIGDDIKIEKDRSIYRQVDQYAISAKVGVGIEDNDAVVLVKNLALGI